MTEEAELEAYSTNVKKRIKRALLDRNMKQTELAELINENPQQLNRAIAGDMTPKSIKIRTKIYKVLDIG